jgi:hypothetical protein
MRGRLLRWILAFSVPIAIVAAMSTGAFAWYWHHWGAWSWALTAIQKHKLPDGVTLNTHLVRGEPWLGPGIGPTVRDRLRELRSYVNSSDVLMDGSGRPITFYTMRIRDEGPAEKKDEPQIDPNAVDWRQIRALERTHTVVVLKVIYLDD